MSIGGSNELTSVTIRSMLDFETSGPACVSDSRNIRSPSMHCGNRANGTCTSTTDAVSDPQKYAVLSPAKEHSSNMHIERSHRSLSQLGREFGNGSCRCLAYRNATPAIVSHMHSLHGTKIRAPRMLYQTVTQ